MSKKPEICCKGYETYEISCIASDPDKDSLIYTWSATGGKIIGDGATIPWICPGGSQSTISVVVSDSRGGKDALNFVMKGGCSRTLIK
jgi:hypothetical protein